MWRWVPSCSRNKPAVPSVGSFQLDCPLTWWWRDSIFSWLAWILVNEMRSFNQFSFDWTCQLDCRESMGLNFPFFNCENHLYTVLSVKQLSLYTIQITYMALEALELSLKVKSSWWIVYYLAYKKVVVGELKYWYLRIVVIFVLTVTMDTNFKYYYFFFSPAVYEFWLP